MAGTALCHDHGVVNQTPRTYHGVAKYEQRGRPRSRQGDPVAGKRTTVTARQTAAQ